MSKKIIFWVTITILVICFIFAQLWPKILTQMEKNRLEAFEKKVQGR